MPHLQVLSSQHAGQKLDIDKCVLCSPHELIAIVTQSGDVVVYRLNGQIAITIKHPDADPYDNETASSIIVTCVAWSPTGGSLAVAWSDGSWNIHEAEKGEIVLKGDVNEHATNEEPIHVVTGFDWQHHRVAAGADAKVEHDQEDQDLDHLDPDLPRAITLLDPMTVLPKLSALPSHGLRSGADGTRFATQAATDCIFSSARVPNKGRVEILSVQASDGRIRIVIDGTSNVGTVRGVSSAVSLQTVGIPDISSLAIFSQSSNAAIDCSILELPLPELNSALLHVLAHCTSQLNALALYIQRTTQCITHDFTAGLAYPDRLVKSITMTMDERAESRASLTSALVHLAMTGQFHPDIQEWLADIVKETGLKRWDTSMSGMYSAVQTHLHIHMLPALDRVAIAASRIRGFARFYQGSAAFAAEETLFDDILRDSDKLRSKVRAMLETCISEWSLWRVFARWLKLQIEIAIAIPGTKGAAEAEERECVNIDINKTLQYIQSILRSGSALTASLTTQNQSKSIQPDHKSDIALTVLVRALDDSTQRALQSITDWQGRLFRKPQSLQLRMPESCQLRDLAYMHQQDLKAHGSILFAGLTIDEDIPRLVLMSTDTAHLTGSSSSTLDLLCVLEDVIDACFIPGSEQMLVLKSNAGPGTEDGVDLQLLEFNPISGQSRAVHQISRPEGGRLLVAGRKGKEFCVIFNHNATAWHVLDLRASSEVAEMDTDMR